MEKFDEVEQLVAFKKKHGWSYEKLAHGIGVHSQTIAAWFNKGAKPTPLVRKAIRTFLIERL